MDIKKEIFNFVSMHEAKVCRTIAKQNADIQVRFTTFGNLAACNALFDIIQVLDPDDQQKVIELMKTKKK